MDDPAHPLFWAGMILLAAGLLHSILPVKDNYTWLWFVGSILLLTTSILIEIMA